MQPGNQVIFFFLPPDCTPSLAYAGSPEAQPSRNAVVVIRVTGGDGPEEVMPSWKLIRARHALERFAREGVCDVGLGRVHRVCYLSLVRGLHTKVKSYLERQGKGTGRVW